MMRHTTDPFFNMAPVKEKGIFVADADSEGPDQTAHPRSLIWAFAVLFFQIHWIL